MRRLMIAMLLLAGCAQITPPSQLEMSKNAGSVLLVVQVANAFKPEHQATSLDVTMKPSDYRPRIVPAGQPDPAAAFQHTLNLVKSDEKSSTFVLLMPLAPGNYILQNMNGASVRFPIMASFQVPVGGAITVRAGRLVYLGRVEAVIRERRSGQEPRAGSLLPLIDQRVAGFSIGTFDVVVKDASAEDLASFQTQLGTVTLDQVDIALVAASPLTYTTPANPQQPTQIATPPAQPVPSAPPVRQEAVAPKPAPAASASLSPSGPWLGVPLGAPDQASMNRSGIGPGRGAIVLPFTKDPKLPPIDLDPGDVILAIDGVEVEGPGHVMALLANKAPGSTVQVWVFRNRSQQRGDQAMVIFQGRR